MATKKDGKTNGFIFQWKIKNISHCLVKHKERILSPDFTSDEPEGTKWKLWFYPMGFSDVLNVSFYLHRKEDCNGPDIVEVNYQLALLDKDGSTLKQLSESRKSFSKSEFSDEEIEYRETLFANDRDSFLPEDTLTVQCAVWKKDETPVKPRYLSALTVFKVNRNSFVWKIADISKVKTGVRSEFCDDLISFDLILNEIMGFVKILDIEIVSFKEGIKKFSLKISLINSDGEKEECGKFKYLAGDFERIVLPMPHFCKMLLENKPRYLLNDELLLDCEYASSDGSVSYELCSYGTISSGVTKVGVKTRRPLKIPFLEDDLKDAYKDGIHSDMELRTSTKSHPAHKFILSARSPVFRRMFSNDMKENNCGHVDVTDLDDETVGRMLLYLYTDDLEDMQFENACKLYGAADKYQIMSLRTRCSFFLKNNLIPSKACALMTLADQHHDDDFKNAVLDYILKYDQEVFGSQEWKQFMDTQLKLAADIMFRKVFPH